MKSLSQTAISVLDLVPYPEGKNISDAFKNTLELSQHAEKLGYLRYWMAEHHNLEGIASAATAVLIGYVAGNTKSIRVGSGGIMLPNHAPLVVAEQFGTLATLYPDRIDLGLGRAPGSDAATMRALRRDHGARGVDFGELIEELVSYTSESQEDQRVKAIPGAGITIPIWILGSSLYSAQLAARLGRPYAFAGHFAPGAMEEAFELYRHQFLPSRYLSKPHTMAGISIIAADTTEHAQFLATSMYQRFVSLVRGGLRPTPPPVKHMDAYWTIQEKMTVESMTRTMIVGDKESVRRGMQNFIDSTQVDELIITSDVYDHKERLKSFEIIADAKKSAL